MGLVGANNYPTAVFHGLNNPCGENGMTDYTKEVSKGTNAYAECIEIGNGRLDSIFMSMTS